MDFKNIENIAFVAYVATKVFNFTMKMNTINNRRWWVRELNINRKTEGFFEKNFQKLKSDDPEHFFKITRMKQSTFDLLVQLISNRLIKFSIREYIDPECRIFLTLLYLSQGAPIQVLAWMFKMGQTTVRNIIYETCEIIWEELMPIYLSPPNDIEWQRIGNDFEYKWNLPNCISSIDGKHINIQCPPNAGSQYYNYKGHHSIVLLASCDANYTFTSVDIRAYGSNSDGGIFAESSFGKRLLKGELKFPAPKVLKNSNFLCNHYLVGDCAFPLKDYLMRPYPTKLTDEKKTYFNSRLSRARRVIENTFGILVARWRILKNTLCMFPENAEKIVKATVVLHNFIKMHDGTYCPPNYVDTYEKTGEVTVGLWRNEINPLPSLKSPLTSNYSSKNAFAMRDDLKEYLYCEKNKMFCNLKRTLINNNNSGNTSKKVKKNNDHQEINSDNHNFNSGNASKESKKHNKHDIEIATLNSLNYMNQKDYKSLDHLSIDYILQSYVDCEKILQSHFNKFRDKKNHRVQRIVGVSHITICGLIHTDIQYKMLEKLGNIYEIPNELPVYTDLFMTLLVPEWVLFIFMKEYNYTRLEAIEEIRNQ